MNPAHITQVLSEAVRDGVIDQDQADRLHARLTGHPERGGNRLLLVFAILGSLLVGLGIILIIAHNWDDLSRGVRTAIAFVPVLLGQGLALYGMLKKPGIAAWREGPALLLACGLMACIALIAQIHQIGGSLDGYLLTCSLLILPLLYLPGSCTAAMGYLAMITWYAWIVRFEGFGSSLRPWYFIPLLTAAVPFYLGQARHHGQSMAFWWLSLLMALAVGIGSQLFYTDWELPHALGLMALAGAFTLVPWLHHGRTLRTWPWVLLGGSTMLITLFVFSFRPVWEDTYADGHEDWPIIAGQMAVGVLAYVWSLRVRKPFAQWPYPEGWWLFALCYLLGLRSPALAAVVVNLALLVLGIITVKHGIEQISLRRMNLGLLILCTTIMMRFFDGDLSFVVRGLVFIVMGFGFLFLNLRMVRQRNQQRHVP
ncbi:MAG: DUF2157 domain-containing protein [Flavobacteriales bacterium]|jgi:hypothetical protein|nr:MAG: DUF2157 domain-containing protein [Flavobacteriales bacterium]